MSKLLVFAVVVAVVFKLKQTNWRRHFGMPAMVVQIATDATVDVRHTRNTDSSRP